MGLRPGLHQFACLCLALGALAPAQAASGARDTRIDVVTGPTPPAITLDHATLRDIFLKRIVIDNSGKALVPLNLAADDPLRVAFSRALMGKAPDSLQRFWNERYFQGVSPPYVLSSQEAMLRFIAETPGAIGYVASCRADERVRVVAELAVPPNLAPGIASLCPVGSHRAAE
jgi:ABC-type phosphate transport system substrate-binding protein